MSKKLKIEYKKLTDVIPYINNSREHSQEQIDIIKSSVVEFAMCNPVVGGHWRFLALQQLKKIEEFDYSEVKINTLPSETIAYLESRISSWDKLQ